MGVLDETKTAAETQHLAEHGSLHKHYNRDERPVYTNATSGASLGLDLANGQVQDITLTANCTFTFTGSSASSAYGFLLILRQDATGNRTATWPGSVSWPNGTAPVLSSAASAVTLIRFDTVNNGTTWYGLPLSDMYTQGEVDSAVAVVAGDLSDHESADDPHTYSPIELHYNTGTSKYPNRVVTSKSVIYVGTVAPSDANSVSGSDGPDNGDRWWDTTVA